MDKLKIGYFADGPWSHAAFELLIKDSTISIEFIVPRTDTKDETLKKYSEKYDIDYLCPIKINSVEFYQKALKYDCDLFISMSFNQIFKNEIINLPKLKTINCHAGKLPFYRGRNILNWVLINDEKEFGITVHYIDEGIDTGDIILQRTFNISDSDTYETLLKMAFVECAKILYDAVKNIQIGKYDRVKQNTIHPIGFYCGGRGVGDEIINWNQSSREIFNFIRSICTPGPIARSYINGHEVKINKARFISQAPSYMNTAGQIIEKTVNGYLVKTKDSFIELLEVDTTLKVGDKLG